MNKQNCRIWDDTNPRARYTSSKCILKKSLFGVDFGLAESSVCTSSKMKRAITINGERYRSMISNFLWAKMDDTDNMWFQQALRAISHATTFCTSDLRAWYLARRRRKLATEIMRFMPLDLFLWGYLKSQVYTNKPQTIDALKVNKRHPPNSARFMQESHRKLDRPNTCH